MYDVVVSAAGRPAKRRSGARRRASCGPTGIKGRRTAGDWSHSAISTNEPRRASTVVVLWALGLLHDRGALSQRELGTLMDVDPSILVTLLNPLEADGYLSRERDADDRRRHVVTITQQGQQQLERAAQAQRDTEDELLASLTKTQRSQLRRLLLILREQFSAEADSACTAAGNATRN